jgi:hydrogenase maturation protease
MKKNQIAIIGCGNPLMGNDGAGVRVMQLLDGMVAGVDCIDGGTGGFGLIPLMEGYEKVVIGDAMVGVGDHVGDLLVFEVPPFHDYPRSGLHEIGIGEAVAIALELGYAREVITIGIEVGEIRAFSQEIDQAVREGIRVACGRILTILEKWTGEAGGVESASVETSPP